MSDARMIVQYFAGQGEVQNLPATVRHCLVEKHPAGSKKEGVRHLVALLIDISASSDPASRAWKDIANRGLSFS
jgi:hypothetical protein